MAQWMEWPVKWVVTVDVPVEAVDSRKWLAIFHAAEGSKQISLKNSALHLDGAVSRHSLLPFCRYTDSHSNLDGPVLDPLLLHKVQAKIKINPLLASSEDNPDGDFLNWNMLYRSATCRRSSDREQQSWMIGRDDPATFPRVKMIRIVCKGLPWVFTINALDPEAGLTCGEVIDGIDEHLVKYTSKEEITTASNQRDILTSYRHNRSVHGPGGRLGQAILRKDWLLNTTAFAGITKNDSLAKAHCGGALLPCTFELKCETGFRPSADELEDEDNYDREQERERERRGRRSRHSSMSRPKSRPTSGLNVIE